MVTKLYIFVLIDSQFPLHTRKDCRLKQKYLVTKLTLIQK
jgi:hypothetical protein